MAPLALGPRMAVLLLAALVLAASLIPGHGAHAQGLQTRKLLQVDSLGNSSSGNPVGDSVSSVDGATAAALLAALMSASGTGPATNAGSANVDARARQSYPGTPGSRAGANNTGATQYANVDGRSLQSGIPGTPGSQAGRNNTAAGGRRLLQDLSVLNNQFSLNGPLNTKVNEDGSVSISLTSEGGAGFTSKQAYPFGTFSIEAKLMSGYSAGVCSTFFLINGDYSTRGEFDHEFLGSATNGSGLTLQTNYFQNGQGNHEVLTSYGFDASADFHTYAIEWGPTQTVWSVDGKPIRTLPNSGEGYPTAPVTVATSIWDASEWATGPREARIPVNYQYQPFTATFRNFKYVAAASS